MPAPAAAPPARPGGELDLAAQHAGAERRELATLAAGEGSAGTKGIAGTGEDERPMRGWSLEEAWTWVYLSYRIVWDVRTSGMDTATVYSLRETWESSAATSSSGTRNPVKTSSTRRSRPLVQHLTIATTMLAVNTHAAAAQV